MKRWGMVEWSVIVCSMAVPLGGIAMEVLLLFPGTPLPDAALRWFTFGAVGLRLCGAGCKQILQPDFTAREIFCVEDHRVLPIVRELGFANVCIGSLGLLSFFLPLLRVSGAVAGGLYFGAAGLQHVSRPDKSRGETFAMVSDLAIFAVLFALLVLCLVGGEEHVRPV